MGVGKRGETMVFDFRCCLPDNRRVRCIEREGPDSANDTITGFFQGRSHTPNIGAGIESYIMYLPLCSKYPDRTVILQLSFISLGQKIGAYQIW